MCKISKCSYSQVQAMWKERKSYNVIKTDRKCNLLKVRSPGRHCCDRHWPQPISTDGKGAAGGVTGRNYTGVTERSQKPSRLRRGPYFIKSGSAHY